MPLTLKIKSKVGNLVCSRETNVVSLLFERLNIELNQKTIIK